MSETKTLTIDGVNYNVVPHAQPGSAMRCHAAPVLHLVDADGKVVGSLTVRRSPKGWMKPVRSGVAKGLTEYQARCALKANDVPCS